MDNTRYTCCLCNLTDLLETVFMRNHHRCVIMYTREKKSSNKNLIGPLNKTHAKG